MKTSACLSAGVTQLFVCQSLVIKILSVFIGLMINCFEDVCDKMHNALKLRIIKLIRCYYYVLNFTLPSVICYVLMQINFIVTDMWLNYQHFKTDSGLCMLCFRYC